MGKTAFDKQGSHTVTGAELKKLRQGEQPDRSDGQTVTMSGLEPIADRIVVKRDAAESATPGGIVIPEMAKDKPQYGTVIAVGHGLRLSCVMTIPSSRPAIAAGSAIGRAIDVPRVKMQCQVGDRVIISAYAETITLHGEELVILHETEVLAILR